MKIPEISKIEIIDKDPNRKVKCCYCSNIVNRSILPHIRKEHPEKWDMWKEKMIDYYNKGNNPKKIMYDIFSVNKQPLFTWSVIEKEINIMIEEGKPVNLPVKKNITKWEPEDNKFMKWLDKTTTWHFKKRGDWATHSGRYRGNWPPQIPRYFISKYTKPGDWVFDGFLGGGTTLVECKLLGRNAIGYDINPFAVNITKKQLDVIDEESKKSLIKLPSSKIIVEENDVISTKNIKDKFFDLICTHPPYFNSLKYTHGNQRDLSRINSVDKFLENIALASKNFYRVLKPKKKCVILIGDIRKKNFIYPLGSKVMDVFLDQKFKLKDTIIKQQYNDRSTSFYVNQKIRRINHEYLYIFEK